MSKIQIEGDTVFSKEKITANGKTYEITAARSDDHSSKLADGFLDDYKTVQLVNQRMDEIDLKIDNLARKSITKQDIIGFSADIFELKRIMIEYFGRDSSLSFYGKLGGKLDPYINRLQVMGVEHAYIGDFIKKIQGRIGNRGRLDGGIDDLIKQEMVRWFDDQIRISPRWEKSEISESSINVIIGGSGV